MNYFKRRPMLIDIYLRSGHSQMVVIVSSSCSIHPKSCPILGLNFDKYFPLNCWINRNVTLFMERGGKFKGKGYSTYWFLMIFGSGGSYHTLIQYVFNEGKMSLSFKKKCKRTIGFLGKSTFLSEIFENDSLVSGSFAKKLSLSIETLKENAHLLLFLKQ